MDSGEWHEGTARLLHDLVYVEDQTVRAVEPGRARSLVGYVQAVSILEAIAPSQERVRSAIDEVDALWADDDLLRSGHDREPDLLTTFLVTRALTATAPPEAYAELSDRAAGALRLLLDEPEAVRVDGVEDDADDLLEMASLELAGLLARARGLPGADGDAEGRDLVEEAIAAYGDPAALCDLRAVDSADEVRRALALRASGHTCETPEVEYRLGAGTDWVTGADEVARYRLLLDSGLLTPGGLQEAVRVIEDLLASDGATAGHRQGSGPLTSVALVAEAAHALDLELRLPDGVEASAERVVRWRGELPDSVEGADATHTLIVLLGLAQLPVEAQEAADVRFEELRAAISAEVVAEEFGEAGAEALLAQVGGDPAGELADGPPDAGWAELALTSASCGTLEGLDRDVREVVSEVTEGYASGEVDLGNIGLLPPLRLAEGMRSCGIEGAGPVDEVAGRARERVEALGAGEATAADGAEVVDGWMATEYLCLAGEDFEVPDPRAWVDDTLVRDEGGVADSPEGGAFAVEPSYALIRLERMHALEGCDPWLGFGEGL